MELLFIVYITGAVLAYGFAFGYYQNKYKRIAKEGYCGDMLFSLLMGIGSWCGLLALFMVSLSRNSTRYIRFKLY